MVRYSARIFDWSDQEPREMDVKTRKRLTIGSLNMRVFEMWMATGSELFFLFNLSSHNHIYNAKYLFSIRDD